MSITIPRQHWTPRQWSRLVTWLAQALAAGLKWVTAPVTIAATASRSGQPLRWKQMVMDELSYLLFVLLIPAHHPLRSASDLSDSGVDVRQRHTLRERDALWPPPDAGALSHFRKRLENWSAPTARGWSVWEDDYFFQDPPQTLKVYFTVKVVHRYRLSGDQQRPLGSSTRVG